MNALEHAVCALALVLYNVLLVPEMVGNSMFIVVIIISDFSRAGCAGLLCLRGRLLGPFHVAEPLNA